MAPKKNATGAKRARSESPSNSNDSTGTPRTTAKKIGNRKPLSQVRSPEVMEQLALKKSQGDIWKDVKPFVRRSKDADFDAATIMKFMTWNVAGLRGLLKKRETAIADLLKEETPDVLCLQETKLNASDAEANRKLGVVDGYTIVDHPCSVKNGYSGTRMYMKNSSMVNALKATATRGFHIPGETEAESGDEEGRVLSTFFEAPWAGAKVGSGPSLALVSSYVPNSGMELDRLAYRTQDFDVAMRNFLGRVDTLCTQHAPVDAHGVPRGGFIWTGDLNVSESDYDRYFSGTYKTMQAVSGFTPEERMSFRKTLSATKSVDTFRALYPNTGPAYTYWSMRFNGRAKDAGWRLDYFVVSSAIAPQVVDCYPRHDVLGSDHCPVVMWLRKQ